MRNKFWFFASPTAGLLLVIALTGCNKKDASLLAPAGSDARFLREEATTNRFLPRGGAKLSFTLDDPNAAYVEDSRDHWQANSWVTTATNFTLSVHNEGTQPAEDLELLVVVPSVLPSNGWSVTIGGIVYSSPSDFPGIRLSGSSYPILPHQIYAPQGNGRFALIRGPASLPPGESWDVPIQLYRGRVKGFKVHFDAAGSPYWISPDADVTAVPPVEIELAGRLPKTS